MTISEDLRWRAVSNVYIYALPIGVVAEMLQVSIRSIKRWYSYFEATGSVQPRRRRTRVFPWPDEVLSHVSTYIRDNPCFYLDELQEEMKNGFPEVTNISIATICRTLRHKLGLTRKVLEKRAIEARPEEIQDFAERLGPFYTSADQLVFVDETAKDSRGTQRRYAWSARGTPAVTSVPFNRGKRVSALCALDINGFISWEITEGTFNRMAFHEAMIKNVLPFLNPYPLSRSILILDNARIHLYQELLDAVEQTGALIFFLPPYSPQLNPIELAFAEVKNYLQRHASLAFKDQPKDVFHRCLTLLSRNQSMRNTYSHCGYAEKSLSIEVPVNL